ncbi:hypothetical protein Q5H92_26370 [Hymenobacter sp. M29]|uniref:Uncharacterized protein n=1 Tax=Hymenobacter mellowenesis TaxID=3063995 RepID=A0ABT9AJ64_9BACT|nr:hypothetical protein [Hymenobacter sp. M29]MDO7849912.1 hypothetical protein [Hymenobacter sp. M29]
MEVTNEIKDALKQFADRLPSTEHVEKAPRLGAELIKKYGGKLKQPDGSPLNPTHRYRIGGGDVAVNHYKRLLRVFETEGMPGVVEYLQPYEAFLHTPDSEAQAQAEAAALALAMAPDVAPVDKPTGPRLAEGFPEGRFEMNCSTCPLSTCSASCSAEAHTPAPAPKVKKRKAGRVAVISKSIAE